MSERDLIDRDCLFLFFFCSKAQIPMALPIFTRNNKPTPMCTISNNVCLCKREREIETVRKKERETERDRDRERDREREREREREIEREGEKYWVCVREREQD